MVDRVLSTLICNGKSKEYTICLSTERYVYSLGQYHGETTEQIQLNPKIIPNLKNIKSIDCGLFHTVCLDFEGNVFSLGENSLGQLGFESFGSISEPKQVDIPPIKQISCGDHLFS